MISESVKKNSLYIKLSAVLTNRLFLVVLFTAMTAVAANIAIPLKPVPFTLQTLLVLLSGAFLGKKDGFYSQIGYLALGAAGLPVFAFVPDGTFGVASLFGPTGGYLLAFPVAAFLTGAIIEKSKSYFSVISALTLGEVVITLSGILFLNTFYVQDLAVAAQAGGLIFLLWTVVKIFIGSTLVSKIKK